MLLAYICAVGNLDLILPGFGIVDRSQIDPNLKHHSRFGLKFSVQSQESKKFRIPIPGIGAVTLIVHVKNTLGLHLLQLLNLKCSGKQNEC